MLIISPCCKSSVDIGRRENEFRSVDLIDVCSECGKEVEEIFYACEYCGEPADRFVQTMIGEWCESCVQNNADILMEREETA